jgi:hypothetical protein
LYKPNSPPSLFFLFNYSIDKKEKKIPSKGSQWGGLEQHHQLGPSGLRRDRTVKTTRRGRPRRLHGKALVSCLERPPNQRQSNWPTASLRTTRDKNAPVCNVYAPVCNFYAPVCNFDQLYLGQYEEAQGRTCAADLVLLAPTRTHRAFVRIPYLEIMYRNSFLILEEFFFS